MVTHGYEKGFIGPYQWKDCDIVQDEEVASRYWLAVGALEI